MTKHAVVIAGGGPTGLMLAGELALAGVEVAIVERRATQDLARVNTRSGPWAVSRLLHDAQPGLLNLGEPGGIDITPWAIEFSWSNARFRWSVGASGTGSVAAPTAVLIRPDGYVAWVGDLTQLGLADALTTWFRPPVAA